MAVNSIDRLATVVGASGLIGRYVVQELCRQGFRVRALCRDAQRVLFLKPLGDLGQVQIGQIDITRPEGHVAALDGSDVVINLVGVLKGDFEALHVTGAAHLAKAARAVGASTFVHVSAIGADDESESAYGRSKAAGEAQVRDAFPDATIVRPSVLFAAEDNFLNRFAKMVRYMPVVPVVRPDVRLQPAWVGDVAKAIAMAAVDKERFGGGVYSLGGPRAYRFEELIAWIAETIRCNRVLVPLPDTVGGIIAAFGFVPGAPITQDQWRMLAKDNIVPEGAPGFEAFNIEPTPLEVLAPDWLTHYRRYGRFNEARPATVR